ncbi:hypothetical protein WJX77_001824 [Trebouxia sp. C0004]
MDDNQFREINKDSELFNNVTYTSDRNGSSVVVTVGIETQNRGGAKYLVLEHIFMQEGDGQMSRVLAPGNIPEAQKATGMFNKVLADMTRRLIDRPQSADRSTELQIFFGSKLLYSTQEQEQSVWWTRLQANMHSCAAKLGGAWYLQLGYLILALLLGTSQLEQQGRLQAGERAVSLVNKPTCTHVPSLEVIPEWFKPIFSSWNMGIFRNMGNSP